MPLCRPVCAVPSCESTPVVAFGSGGSPRFGQGFGFGSGLGYGYNSGFGGYSTDAGSLGVLRGVNPKCINQIPPSELTIQPPEVIVTIPGPILSASCEPIRVGGYSPGAVGGAGISGFGSGFYGGHLGRRCGSLGGRGFNCL